MPAASAPTDVTTTRRGIRLLLAVLVTATVVDVLNNSMVTVFLPQIRQDFGAGAAAANWVVTGFSLAFAVGTPLYGRVADLWGIRWVFCAGLAVFTGASLLAAGAGSLSVLILARVLQGAGGAAIPALGAATVAAVLPPGRRGLAFGMIATAVGAGQALGPVVGGLVAQAAGWHAPFLGTAALAALVLGAASRVLPVGAASGPGASQRVDLLGGLLLGGAAALVLTGVTRVQQAGAADPSAWGSLLVALALGAAFAARIRSTPEPFAPPALFRTPAFLTATGVGMLAMCCYLGAVVLVPQLVVSVNGLSVGHTGLVLLPGAAVVASSSAVVGRLSDRFGPQPLVVTGLGVLLASIVALSTLAGHSAPVIASLMLGVGLGFALVVSPVLNAASAAVPAAHSGVGLGIYQGAFFLGGGVGAAGLGAVLSARLPAAGAWNPVHHGAAAGFSDALLVDAGVLVLALVLALRLPGATARRSAEVARSS